MCEPPKHSIFNMVHWSASSPMKARSNRSRYPGSKLPFLRCLYSPGLFSLALVGTLLLLCAISVRFGNGQCLELHDRLISLLRVLLLILGAMPASNLWTCWTFGSSFLGSVMGGVAMHRNTAPAAAFNSSATSIREFEAALSTESYAKWTVSAIKVLQGWYDEDQGLWLSTNWWNSANCLTVLGDFLAVDGNEARNLDLADVFSNTFIQAQISSQTTNKRLATRQNCLQVVESHQEQNPDTRLVKRGYRGFLDDYYDDEGWWALAWIRAYDVIGNEEFLSMAERIFHDMKGGLANGTCGGGIWWDKARSYKNAIANELFLSVAASLANRAAHSKAYLAIAEGQWAWFQRSGMINTKNLINDGLLIYVNGTCVNNGKTVWSYNQGVILGGLVELYKANGDSSLLSRAAEIAEAAISALSIDGILHDSCENEYCGPDGSQFKGTKTSTH